MPSNPAIESFEEYTVAWIAALPHERAAGEAMFDTRHEEPPPGFHQNEGDLNTYSWGRIGKHNVVLTSLPVGEYGTNAAATMAQGLCSSLPKLRVGLLVGIGAGVPGELRGGDGRVALRRDVRLGDIAVAMPDSISGGVVQVDLGKAKLSEGQESFERRGFLNSPPIALRTALSKLIARHELEDTSIPNFLEQAYQKHPKMRASYGHPGIGPEGRRDVYYAQDGSEIPREARATPEIHYGIIASSNTLEKSAGHRDKVLERLKKENLDPICFEMEAAGLMNRFPCLVIRGICDYADEHKNDDWQRYAAATAAAFAKEFLQCVNVEEVKKAPGIYAVLENINTVRNEVRSVGSNVSKLVRNVSDREFRELLEWLCPKNCSMQYDSNIGNVLAGTCDEFTENPMFQEWAKSSTRSTILCYGDPGTGKTMLATRVIQYLSESNRGHTDAILYLYCNYARQEDQTATHLLGSLLQQIIFANGAATSQVRNLQSHHSSGENRRPTINEILSALEDAAANFETVFIVIDALDECKANVRIQLLKSIQHLIACSNAKVLATSRPHISPEFYVFPNEAQLRVRASDADIEKYVRLHWNEMPEFDQSIEDILNEAIKAIVLAVRGVFLLARLHVNALKEKCTIADIKYALRTLPEGSEAYDKTYDLAIARIEAQPRDHRNLAEAALKWIIYARRPLQPRELQDALAVEHGKTSLDTERVPPISIVLSVCGGLIAVTQGGTNYRTDLQEESVQLVHYTAHEYFVRVHATSRGWSSSASFALAQTCLAYLSSSAFASGPCGKLKEFTRRSEKHALFTYAAKYWGVHARDNEQTACQKNSETLHDAICTFFGQTASLNSAFEALQPRLFWQEILDYRRPLQTTGSHLAAFFGLRLLFEVRLSKSDQIDRQDSFGRTPLSYSASEGHVDVVQWLLNSERVNINSKDIDGVTPLSHAVQSGHQEVVSLLIKSPDIDPNLRDVTGRTPLLEASQDGQNEVISLLLKFPGIKPNLADVSEVAPLIQAIRSGHESTAELLLTSKWIDVNRQDMYQRTPLMEAARAGYPRIARRLLEFHEVDTALWDVEGRTMLSQAAEFGHDEIIELMLSKEDVDVDMKDECGQTLLSRAAELGKKRIVHLLLLSGQVEIDSTDVHGRTPLMHASNAGHDQIIGWLLQSGKANTKSKDAFGWTPLAFAARRAKKKAVKLLLAEMRKDESSFSEEVLRARGMVLKDRDIMTRASHQRRGIIRDFHGPPLKMFC